MTTLRIPIGAGARPAYIAARYANRHGLIAGATGTGKSVTLMTLAEGFSRAGVPVFMADVKGDLARLASTNPVRTLDVFGQSGRRMTLRLDSLGADLIARMLDLTDIQRGALDVAFAIAQSERRPLSDLFSLKRLLHRMAQSHKAISATYGLVAPSSIAAIQRALLGLDAAGCNALFGQTTYDVAELLDHMPAGLGVITRLDAVRLMRSPRLYATALLFILSDLYERLPEVGDLEAPRLVLFFDEAHLMFQDIAPALLQRIERMVRLIRSKGVGVYFASQSPMDIPPVILGQLGNRVQHGLRGATLADQRAIRATAETLPINPAIDAVAAIGKLGVGSALVSTIGEDGVPRPVDMVYVYKPKCMSPAWPEADAPWPAAQPPYPQPVMPEVEALDQPNARGTFLAAVVIIGGALLVFAALRALIGL